MLSSFSLVSNSLSISFFPAGILIALVYLGCVSQLWYIPAFLVAGFVFGQSIGQTPRHGLTGFPALPSLLLGFDWDLPGLSGTPQVFSKVTSLYSKFIFYSEMVSLMPIFIYMGYYLYDHFHAQALAFTVGKALALPFGLLCLEGTNIFNTKKLIRTFLFFFLLWPFICQCLPAIVLFEKL